MSFFSSDLTPTDWILSKWKKLRVRCVRIKVSGQLWQLHNASHLKESIDVAFFYRFIFTASVFVMAWLSSLTSCSQVFIWGAIASLAWLLFMCCPFQYVSRMITCPSIRPTLVTSHSLTGSSVDRGGKIRESLRKSSKVSESDVSGHRSIPLMWENHLEFDATGHLVSNLSVLEAKAFVTSRTCVYSHHSWEPWKRSLRLLKQLQIYHFLSRLPTITIHIMNGTCTCGILFAPLWEFFTIFSLLHFLDH